MHNFYHSLCIFFHCYYFLQLSDKDVSMLEEKIRRYGKKAPQALPPAAPPTTEAQAPPTSSEQSVAAAPPGRGRGRGGGTTGRPVNK